MPPHRKPHDGQVGWAESSGAVREGSEEKVGSCVPPLWVPHQGCLCSNPSF